MGRHAFRGVITAWMTLIVLRTVGTAGGSGKLSGLFADADKLVQHALSADVPAIPDRRTGGAAAPTYFGVTPQAAKAGAEVAANLPATTAITDPGGLFGDNLNQYATGGGLAGVVNNRALR